jgi:hypothetical protein
LPAGQHFRVRTEHLTVEVVGTDFTVSLLGECTRVDVTEGRVRVRSTSDEELLLSAGQWQQHCVSPGEALVREALALVLAGKEPERAAGLLRRYLAEQPRGPFEEEALFHLWLVESRGPAATAARATADALLQRFPSSPRAERVRLWRNVNR